MIYASFIIGLLGSWHCIGMCGPIALMIPGSKGKNRLLSISLYHGGKLLTYMLIGSFFGLVPALTNSFFVQAIITIFVGIVMLLIAGMPLILNSIEKFGFTKFQKFFKLKTKLAKLIKTDKIEFSFYIGVLNGFIPCGLVYFAALGAISQPTFVSSILFMLFFGLGTIPLMFLFLLLPGILKPSTRNYLNKFRQVGFAAVAVIMLWKGFSNIHTSIQPPLEGEAFQICTTLHR